MSSGVWEVLGIEPTTDAATIRKAYAARLKAIKRDLDPHAFQELRGAYEWALGQAAGDGSLAPASAPAPREPLTGYGSATPSPPVIVTTGPPPTPRRQRWKDVVGPPGEAPPPGQRRKRDAVEAPASGPDERERVEQALAGVRAAFLSQYPAHAAASFATIHAEISHPVTGVSIAALAAFERELLRLVATRVSEGEAVAAVAREASRLMGWAERARDVNGDLDPLAGSLAGFLAAEEIGRCARGESPHHSPIGQEFARDLTGPASPMAFAGRIVQRVRYHERQVQFAHLEQLAGSPLAWLPQANVQWWRRALGEPRFFPMDVLKGLAFICASVVPFGLALAGRTIEYVVMSFVGLLLFAGVVFPIFVYRQDSPALAFLKPAWRFLDRIHRWLARSRVIAGVELNVWRHLVFPFVFAMFVAGLFETLKDASAIKPPLALWNDFGGWLLVAWAYLCIQFGYRLVAHWASRWERQNWRAAVGFVGMFLGIPIFVGMMAAFDGRDVLGATKAAGVVVGVLAVIVGAIYGVRALIARVPEVWRPLAMGALLVLGPPLLMFGITVRADGLSAALEGAAFLGGGLGALVVPIVAIMYLSRYGSRIPILSEQAFRARFPRMFAWGLRPRNWAIALVVGGLFCFVMMLQSSYGLGWEALWGGLILGGAVFLMVLAFLADRDRLR